MNCREVQEEIAVALLTRTGLDPVAAAHVSTCPECAAEQASLRGVTAIMAAASPTDVPSSAAMPNEMHLQRILSAVARERAQRRRRTLLRTLAVAAAAVIVAVGIGFGVMAAAGGEKSIANVAHLSPATGIAFAITLILQFLLQILQLVMIYGPFGVAYQQLHGDPPADPLRALPEHG